MGTLIAAPQERFAGGRRKGPQPVAPRRPRREFAEEPEVSEAEGGYNRGRKRTGVRLTFRGGLPETAVGRILAAVTGLAILGASAAAAVATRHMMLHDGRFVIPSSAAIETVGTERLSRAELLNALRDDVGKNLFAMSLDAQRADLEHIPWVEHASVMRLLPDHLRASVTERTPIAFVREQGRIGLVDAHGVLLDLRQAGTGSEAKGNYSFPVVTGILAADPLSVRAARVKIFEEFMAELDASGEHISAKLSEVDLSNPEDVKALIPDGDAEVLVHFGDQDYLERYRKYEAHLAEWRSQYPKLSSVDMRYDRQAVLEMQPGSEVPLNEASTASREAAAAREAKALTPPARAKTVPAKSAHAAGNPGKAAAASKHPSARSVPR